LHTTKEQQQQKANKQTNKQTNKKTNVTLALYTQVYKLLLAKNMLGVTL